MSLLMDFDKTSPAKNPAMIGCKPRSSKVTTTPIIKAKIIRTSDSKRSFSSLRFGKKSRILGRPYAKATMMMVRIK